MLCERIYEDLSKMKKPKYIIFDKFQGMYFLDYMGGYSCEVEEAYKYSEEEILEILEEDDFWLDNCKLIQTYNW